MACIRIVRVLYYFDRPGTLREHPYECLNSKQYASASRNVKTCVSVCFERYTQLSNSESSEYHIYLLFCSFDTTQGNLAWSGILFPSFFCVRGPRKRPRAVRAPRGNMESNIRRYRRSSSPVPMDSPVVSERENEIKSIDPETSTPTVGIRVPELRNEMSYWQIGTASLTRVKINALRPEVKIRTKDAGRIVGMFSEGYSHVATLGTAIIHIGDTPVKVHVTRSKLTAPIVSDGVLGCEFLKPSICPKTFRLLLPGLPPSIPLLTGKDLIVDYRSLLRRRLIEASVAHERGPWSVVSKRLSRLQKFLPRAVAEDERLPVIEIMEEYADCFHLPSEKLGFTKLIKYRVKLKNDNIVAIPRNNLSRENWEEIDRQVEYLLDQEIIRVSTSAYNSPIRLIEKKPDSRGNVRHRLAADFHELNKHSEGDAFPIPDIVELVDLLQGSKYFSVFDLASASYQIELDPADREKTAFTTRNGRYEFQRMPLGIKNATQNIQRLLNLVIDDMLYSPSMAFVCYDDILVHASSIEEHEVRVRKLLSRIRDAGLKLQPAKCQLFQRSVAYLGFLVTEEGLRPDPAKIEKIRNYELPKTRHCLSCFLGLLSSFKRFVPNYAERAKPMSNLLRNNDETFEWTSEGRRSFDDVKGAFSRDLLLQYPDWDESFILETSSSDVAIQASLLQKRSINSETLPIAYASRCYTPAEMNYDRYNRERLAAMYGMDTWYWYLSDANGNKFVLRTPEPRAFDWYVRRHSHKSPILGRFEMSFSGKDFTIETLPTMK